MGGRDQGFGIRGSGLGIRGPALGLALLLSYASLGYTASQSTTLADRNLKITVRVYVYAEASRGTLSRAEEEASRIFRQAGVGITWLDCPTSHAEEDKYPACALPTDVMAVDLRILPPSMAERIKSNREEVGLAMPSVRAGRASAAWVFYQRVEDLATSQAATESQVLGHVIAHEIGHLLLGPSHHSPSGIMRANWGRRYLEEASRGQLLFTREQAEAIRSEVRIRAQHDAILKAASTAPQE